MSEWPIRRFVRIAPEDPMANSVLEEAAFRAWYAAPDGTVNFRRDRRTWDDEDEYVREAYKRKAGAVLAYAAEIVTGEQPVSLGIEDDAQRAICRRIANKLTGVS